MKYHSTIITAVVSLSAFSTAAAIPAAEASSSGVTLSKRDPNGANCWKWTDHYSSYFSLDTWGSWDDDWGTGFLDNLRGQCLYNIEDWGFSYAQGPSPTNGKASFKTAGLGDFQNSGCVEEALWLASNPTGAIWNVKCQEV